jgi:hypothetical protein
VNAIEDRLANAIAGHEVAKSYLSKKRSEFLFGEAKRMTLQLSYGFANQEQNKVTPLERTCIQIRGPASLCAWAPDFSECALNGNPHPGNCLELEDGRLSLIDYR